MPEGDALKDTITKYDLPGEIRSGFVHLHVITGHLHEAHIGTQFARAYAIPATCPRGGREQKREQKGEGYGRAPWAGPTQAPEDGHRQPCCQKLLRRSAQPWTCSPYPPASALSRIAVLFSLRWSPLSPLNSLMSSLSSSGRAW